MTGTRGKFSLSRMGRRITFVRTTSCSMLHWKRMESMQNSTHNLQTHLMLICWAWGFFRAIQSFNDAAPRNEEELIKAVGEAYENYPKEKINWTWLTLQCCFDQIITHHGDNDYNINHISKEKLERNGNLPDVIDVVDFAEDLLDPNSTDEDESESEMTYSYT